MVWDALRKDEFTFLPYPFQRRPTVRKSFDALAVGLPVLELPDVLVTVSMDISALAGALTVLVLPDVLIPLKLALG